MVQYLARISRVKKSFFFSPGCPAKKYCQLFSCHGKKFAYFGEKSVQFGKKLNNLARNIVNFFSRREWYHQRFWKTAGAGFIPVKEQGTSWLNGHRLVKLFCVGIIFQAKTSGWLRTPGRPFRPLRRSSKALTASSGKRLDIQGWLIEILVSIHIDRVLCETFLWTVMYRPKMGIVKAIKLGLISKLFLFCKTVQDYGNGSADICLIGQVGHSLSTSMWILLFLWTYYRTKVAFHLMVSLVLLADYLTDF